MFRQLRDSVSMTLVGLLIAAGAVALAVVMISRGAPHLGKAWLAVVGLLSVGVGIGYTLVSNRSD